MSVGDGIGLVEAVVWLWSVTVALGLFALAVLKMKADYHWRRYLEAKAGLERVLERQRGRKSDD